MEVMRCRRLVPGVEASCCMMPPDLEALPRGPCSAAWRQKRIAGFDYRLSPSLLVCLPLSASAARVFPLNRLTFQRVDPLEESNTAGIVRVSARSPRRHGTCMAVWCLTCSRTRASSSGAVANPATARDAAPAISGAYPPVSFAGCILSREQGQAHKTGTSVDHSGKHVVTSQQAQAWGTGTFLGYHGICSD